MAARGLSILSVVFLFACGGTEPDPGPGPAISGADVYRQRVSDGNTFTCSTCHALSEPADVRRPGHPIGQAPMRSSFKNGRVSQFLDAVNSCLTEWMAADAWTASDERFVALRDYLNEQPGIAQPITFQIVAPPAELEGGNAAAGQTLFNGSCSICHGMNATGTDRAPSLLRQTPLEAAYIARRVRTSGLESSPIYDGLTGGRMPFFSADRLSDDELRDLIAFVSMAEPDPGPTCENNPNGCVEHQLLAEDCSCLAACDPGFEWNGSACMPPNPSNCDRTHAKIGQTATLSTRFHGVRGTAEIIDDCTIELRDFYYDGTGIDVRVYAGLGGNYRNGFAISDDLIRRGGYTAETLTLTLPDGRTLDQLDGISIWCVDVAIDFGSGTFQ